MTIAIEKRFRTLVLGELWEVDHIFQLWDIFEDTYPCEEVRESDPANFADALNDPSIDLVLIDISRYGRDVLETLLEQRPMRALIMVADVDQAEMVLEAKKKGLERYVIRLEDEELNIRLLAHEVISVLSRLTQPPSLEHPVVEEMFRYAQYYNVRQPFFVIGHGRRLLYVNKAGADLVSQLYGRQIALGDSVDDLTLEESSEQFFAHLDKAFAGEAVEVRLTYEELPEGERHRELCYQPVTDPDGRTVAVSVAVENIGAEVAAEQRYEDIEEALWGYFQRFPLPMKIVNDEGILERSNAAFAQLLGYENAEQVEGLTVDKTVHPDDQERATQALEELCEGRIEYVQGEFRQCRKDGTHVWTNHVWLPLGDDDPAEQILIFATDISEQKEAEHQANQSMRMRAIGELSAGVAHDFNNVLGIVRTVGHVLRMKLEERGDSSLLEYVDKIEHAVERGAELTHQLMTFGREGNGIDEIVDLNHRIRDVGRLLDRTIGENIEIEMDLADGLPPIRIEASQIDQVIMNLSVNARDAMPDGGKLRIETRQAKLARGQGRYRPGLEPGDYVELRVSDTGMGIDEETREHIFEPFFTTKGPGEGTGLGLATVYKIVERAAGQIYVDSQPQKGTTFEICFPAAPEKGAESVEAEPTELAESPEATRPACVLLVEDEEDLREPYRIFLESASHEVIEAATVEEGLRVLQERQPDVDLLLADVVLPDGSGVELARKVNQRFPGVRVVFLSGYAPDLFFGNREDLNLEWDFLAKPVSRDSLLATVREVLRRKRV